MPKSELTIQIGKDGQTIISDTPEGDGARPPEAATKTFQAMTYKEKWDYVREFVTVEPLVVCYLFASGLTGPAFLNLQLQKSCLVDAGYDDTTCDRIVAAKGPEYNLTNEVNAVHLRITDTTSLLTPLALVLPLALSLFWGSFSDRYQIRKPFLLLPLFGELLSVVACIFSVIFLREWNLITFMSLAYFASTFLGGGTLLIVALFAYIADVSTVEQRTMRIGVCQTAMIVASIASNALSGVSFDYLGYYGAFGISFCVQLIGFLYGVFCLKDNLKPKNGERKCLLFDLFDPTLILETCKVMLVKQIGNNRLYVFLFMMVFFVANGVFAGENALTHLYLNALLGFTPVQTSYLTTFSTIISLKGVIIGTYLFTKVFKFSDYTIMLVVYVMKIIGNLVFAAAVNKVMVYIAVYIYLFERLAIIALRSLATKVVRQEDLGKVQSLFAIFETLGGMVFVPIYNQLIYANTQETFPSAYLYAALLLTGICIAIILFMQVRNRRAVSKTSGDKQGIDNNGMIMTETEVSHM